jgi:hypothetical protein
MNAIEVLTLLNLIRFFYYMVCYIVYHVWLGNTDDVPFVMDNITGNSIRETFANSLHPM